MTRFGRMLIIDKFAMNYELWMVANLSIVNTFCITEILGKDRKLKMIRIDIKWLSQVDMPKKNKEVKLTELKISMFCKQYVLTITLAQLNDRIGVKIHVTSSNQTDAGTLLVEV